MQPMKAPPKNLSRRSVRVCTNRRMGYSRSKHSSYSRSCIRAQKVFEEGALSKRPGDGIVGIAKVETCRSRCENGHDVDPTGVRLQQGMAARSVSWQRHCCLDCCQLMGKSRRILGYEALRVEEAWSATVESIRGASNRLLIMVEAQVTPLLLSTWLGDGPSWRIHFLMVRTNFTAYIDHCGGNGKTPRAGWWSNSSRGWCMFSCGVHLDWPG